MSKLLASCESEALELSRLLWGRPQEMQFDTGEGFALAGSQLELYSALFNLIGNAVRYSPSDKSIRVRLPFAARRWGVGRCRGQRLGHCCGTHCHVSLNASIGLTAVGHAIRGVLAWDWPSSSMSHSATALSCASKVHQVRGSVFSLEFPPNRVRVLHPEVLLAETA